MTSVIDISWEHRARPLLSARLIASLVAIILYAAGNVGAQPAPQSRPVAAERVFVGFYVLDVYELDLKKSTYTIDFYIWFRWQGEIDPTDFEFLNGTLDAKEHPDRRDAGGTKYVSYHCRGTFHAIFDYRRYPLDEHELIIEMENASHEATAVEYVVDRDNMNHLPLVQISGWTCGQPRFQVVDHSYETNFGDPTRPKDSSAAYSRLSGGFPVYHRSVSIYVKTFLALFISVAIAFLSFLLKPTNMDPRFGVGLAAIFGAVSSEIVMSGNLPDMPYLTLADKLHLFSLFVVFLTLLLSSVTLRLSQTGRPNLAARVDRVALASFPLLYTIGVIAISK